MKKIFSLIIFALCCVTLSSCNRQQAALDQFEEFVNDVCANATEYTGDEWDEIEIQYEELTDELDQYEYTSAEQRKIGRLKAKYLGAYAKGKASGVMDIVNEVRGAIEEFQNN